MKNWIKKKCEMTTKRRLDVAYWLGTFQAILLMTVLQTIAETGTPSVQMLFAALAVWIVIGFFYIRNSLNFEKETLWMTIKNPAKVTVEQDAAKYTPGGPGRRPTAPPPPPRPPQPLPPPLNITRPS